MVIVRASTKGQIIIPGEIRKKLGLKAGQKLSVELTENGKIQFTPLPQDPVPAFCGIFERGGSLTKALKNERKREIKREQSRRS